VGLTIPGHSQSSDLSVTTRAVFNSSDCELGAFDSLTRTKLMAINTEGKEMSMSTLLLDVMWNDMFFATRGSIIRRSL